MGVKVSHPTLHVDDALDSLDDHLNRRRIPSLRGNDKCYTNLIRSMDNDLKDFFFKLQLNKKAIVWLRHPYGLEIDAKNIERKEEKIEIEL